MAFTDSRVFAGTLQANDPRQVALAFQQLAGFIDNPIADVKITPATPTASPRAVTVQVRDRLGAAWKGRWWVLLMFGNAEWDTSATQTITPTAGHVFVDLKPNQLYLCLTDDSGVLTFTLAGAAGSYYITPSVMGRAQSSGAVVLT